MNIRALNIPVKRNLGLIVIVYTLIAVIASIQCYYGFIRPENAGGRVYPNYNNYIIFKNSFFHLIHGYDLYQPFPLEQWDLYKYSPTFSFAFGIFAFLPDFIGLLCWNLMNTIPLLIGIMQLRDISVNNKILALLFCAVELMGSLQNAQSNGLMAALLILTFTSLENSKYVLATFCVVFSIYLKIYGGIGLLLFLFYPFKAKLFFFTTLWVVLLGILPLLVVNLNQLLSIYTSWENLLKLDEYNSTGVSVMGILHSWFRVNISKNQIMGFGCLLFLSPFFQYWKYKIYNFRLLTLCVMLIWVVIFNYKAESPTYIISVAGISIWFFSREKTKLNILIVTLAFVFTSIASGDLMPVFIRNFLTYYNIKALFSTILFFVLLIDLWKNRAHAA